MSKTISSEVWGSHSGTPESKSPQMWRCMPSAKYKINYISADMVYHSRRLESSSSSSSSSSSHSKIIFIDFKITLKFSTQFYTLFMVGSRCCCHKSSCNDTCTVYMVGSQCYCHKSPCNDTCTVYMVGSQCCCHKSPCNDTCTVYMNTINSHFPNKQYSNLLQVLPTLNS
jgi:hypothetical protein